MRNRAAPRSKRPSAEQPGSTSGSLTKDPPAPGKNRKLSAKMRMDQNPRIPCLGGWTSINPSYLGATDTQKLPHQSPAAAYTFAPNTQIQRPVPTFFGLPSFAASRALHSAVRFIAPRHSRPVRPRRSRGRSNATRGHGWRANARWCHRAPGGLRPCGHGTPGKWQPLVVWDSYGKWPIYRCSIAMFDYQRVALSKLRSTRAWVRGWKIRFHEELAIFRVYLNSVDGFSAPQYGHFTVTLQHSQLWGEIAHWFGSSCNACEKGPSKIERYAVPQSWWIYRWENTKSCSANQSPSSFNP